MARNTQNIEVNLLDILYKAFEETADGFVREETLAALLRYTEGHLKQLITPLQEQGIVQVEQITSRNRSFIRYKLTTKGIENKKRSFDNYLGNISTIKNNPDIKLQITRLDQTFFSARIINQTLFGESVTKNLIPYSSDVLTALLKLLSMGEYDPKRFTEEQARAIREENLLVNGHDLSPEILRLIGSNLYASLFTGNIESSLQASINQARMNKELLLLQLRFDEDSAEIARFPWELIYNRRPLLASGVVEIARYISYPESVTDVLVESPIRLLYIQPRPTNLSKLDSIERTFVKKVVQSAAKEIIKIDFLKKSSFYNLIEYIQLNRVHIIHFDGHGVFGWKCKCGAINYPASSSCKTKLQDGICGQPKISPVMGYLAFEDEDGRTDWISSDELSYILTNHGLVLAIISACRSSDIGWDNLFNGLAPSLIQSGIPAVIAMQLPITSSSAVRFMEGFYRELVRSYSFVHAINKGRLQMLRTNQWFVPTLYLRSKDDQAKILIKNNS